MTADFERRVGDWLEEGPQAVPDWLVEAALAEAHNTQQLGAGIRLPWRPHRSAPEVAIGTGRLVSLAAGAIGALAVVSAFVLGIVTAPRIGIAPPATAPPPSSSPAPSDSLVVPGTEVVNLMPGLERDFYTFIGLATSADAVWTVAVADDPDGVASHLLRIDPATGVATAIDIPGVIGQLSPPTSDGQSVWTASEGGLHRVDAGGVVATVPLDVEPAELTFGTDGLWIARAGGTTLVDPSTGATMREIETVGDGSSDRLVGAPVFGSLWQCEGPGILHRIDPTTGLSGATFALPAGVAANCRSPVRTVTGVTDVEGILPSASSVIVDPTTGDVELRLGLGSWVDFVVLDGSLWFVKPSTSSLNDISLIRIDSATGAAEDFNVDGTLHLNTTFESNYAAIHGAWLWILADGAGGGASASSPTLIRIPVTALAGL